MPFLQPSPCPAHFPQSDLFICVFYHFFPVSFLCWMYVYTFLRTFIRFQVRVYVRLYVFTYVFTYVYTFLRMFLRFYVCFYVYTFLRTFIRFCVCFCVCFCVRFCWTYRMSYTLAGFVEGAIPALLPRRIRGDWRVERGDCRQGTGWRTAGKSDSTPQVRHDIFTFLTIPPIFLRSSLFSREMFALERELLSLGISTPELTDDFQKLYIEDSAGENGTA